MKKEIIIYGYGNPGRQDDGLGNAFIEHLEEWAQENRFDWMDFDSNYQLNIEDAELIADRKVAIFVDASVEDIDDFCVTVVNPEAAQIEFTMHAVSPSFVLQLCNEIYHNSPDTYLLHIKGYEWEFKEEISENAIKNMNKALYYLKDILKAGSMDLINENLSKSVILSHC